MGSFLPCFRSCFAWLLLLMFAACPSLQAHNFNDGGAGSTAKLSTVWTIGRDYDGMPAILDPLPVRSVPGSDHLSFAAVFYCGTAPCACDSDTHLFAICVRPDSGDPVVVWFANRDRLVQGGATLNFTADGDLVLRDSDGSLVWSTNTSGRSVVEMSITESGNLVLFNHNKSPVWQSFDHPTDTMIPQQPLMEGMKLAPNISNTIWPASNQLYLTVHRAGLHASAGSTQHQTYYQNSVFDAGNVYDL